MTAEKPIVKATDLRVGDVVEMPTVGKVRITSATVGKTYGSVPCVHVHGVGPGDVLVDIDYSPGSTFRAVSLKADRLREEIADLVHIVETTNSEDVARMAADARDQLIEELESL